MKRTRIFAAAVGATLIGGAALFSSVASAGGNVGWSVSIGGPGIAVSAGQPAYGRGFVGPAYYGAPYQPYYAPYYRPVVVAPVVYRPYYYAAPYRVYAPRRVVYGHRW